MQVNETKPGLDTPQSSGQISHSLEQIQALCASNSFLRGWLEAFYLSDWNKIKCEDRDSISIENMSVIEH